MVHRIRNDLVDSVTNHTFLRGRVGFAALRASLNARVTAECYSCKCLRWNFGVNRDALCPEVIDSLGCMIVWRVQGEGAWDFQQTRLQRGNRTSEEDPQPEQ